MNQPTTPEPSGGNTQQGVRREGQRRFQDGRARRPGQDQSRQTQDGPSAQRANASDGSSGPPPPKRVGPPGGAVDGREGRKRRKDGNDRRGLYGFGDAIERSTCTSLSYEAPRVWPVQSRSGIATLRAVEVDRRASAVLFCDGAHVGPHIWPDGELAVGSSPTLEPDVIDSPIS